MLLLYSQIMKNERQANQYSQRKPQCRVIASNKSNTLFSNNGIKSTSTNFITFIPLNLFRQLKSMPNIYFIIVALLQTIPAISVTNGTPVILIPLTFVTLAVMIKDAYEQFQRYLKDKSENQKQIEVFDGSKFVYQTWESLMVGNVIKIKKDQCIPCDVIIIKTSDAENKGFVETKSLDGETNLKIKRSFLTNLPNSQIINDFSYQQFYQIQCSSPNCYFSNFDGFVKVPQGTNIPIDYNNLMLRGCILKNVHEAICICVYTGSNTKLVLNSVKFQPKSSKLKEEIEKIIVQIFCWQIIISITCSFLNTLLENSYPAFVQFLPASHFWITTSTWWLLMTYFVPISLVVTMEMVKLFQGSVLAHDQNGYSQPYDCFTSANNTTVNENLGQIRYVFTDKTGTLTKNNMVFRNIICGGQLYGIKQDQEEAINTPMQLRVSVHIYDKKLQQRQSNPVLQDAIRLISLCHDIIVEKQEDKLIYNSSSPDEIALINFAKLYNKQLLGEKNKIIEIAEGLGDKRQIFRYEKLALLEFNSFRKRMSVIIKDPLTKKIIVYTKGADSTIKQLLKYDQKDLQVTQKHIDQLSMKGLRTLMLAKKQITQQEFKRWNGEFLKAKSMIGLIKQQQLQKCYYKLEQNLQLVGATAIEDQLQDDVERTIMDMRLAGMTFFMLTGDKRETAINIGRSCGLIDEDAHLLDIPIQAPDDQHHYLAEIRKLEEISQKKVYLLNAEKSIPKILPDGQTICYRCTPSNKQLIVQYYKNNNPGLTLAIGDGANDVNMITAADVGIGIKGKEGTEAARVADFVTGQFKFVKLLTLYYGREWYRKNTQLVKYSFFKNWIHTSAVVAFGGFSYFSGVVIFDVFLYALFNAIFTCCPIIVWAVFDERNNLYDSYKYTQLYLPGIKNQLFNRSIFLKTIGQAIFFGVLSLLFVVNILQSNILDSNGNIGYLKLSGSILYESIIIMVNLKILQMTTGMKPFIAVISLASILVYWLCEYVYAKLVLQPQLQQLKGSWSYLPVVFMLLILIFIAIFIEFAYRKYLDFRQLYKRFKNQDQNDQENGDLSL